MVSMQTSIGSMPKSYNRYITKSDKLSCYPTNIVLFDQLFDCWQHF